VTLSFVLNSNKYFSLRCGVESFATDALHKVHTNQETWNKLSAIV